MGSLPCVRPGTSQSYLYFSLVQFQFFMSADVFNFFYTGRMLSPNLLSTQNVEQSAQRSRLTLLNLFKSCLRVFVVNFVLKWMLLDVLGAMTYCVFLTIRCCHFQIMLTWNIFFYLICLQFQIICSFVLQSVYAKWLMAHLVVRNSLGCLLNTSVMITCWKVFCNVHKS